MICVGVVFSYFSTAWIFSTRPKPRLIGTPGTYCTCIFIVKSRARALRGTPYNRFGEVPTVDALQIVPGVLYPPDRWVEKMTHCQI